MSKNLKNIIDEELITEEPKNNNNPEIELEFELPSIPISEVKLLNNIIPPNTNICMYYLEKNNIEYPSVSQFNEYSDRGCVGCNGYNTKCKHYLSYKTLHEVMDQFKYIKK